MNKSDAVSESERREFDSCWEDRQRKRKINPSKVRHRENHRVDIRE